MSLLAELEELQRCLEGTAGSDSEGADNHAGPATDFNISEKAVKSSLKNEDKNEGTAVQDSTSSCPLLAQSVCKNSSNESGTKKIVAGSGHSAAKSTAKISKLQTSSLQNNASTRLVSKHSEKEVNATSTHTATVKNDSPDSATLLTNVGKDSAGVKVSNAKTITDTSAKKDCPSKHIKIPALKQGELEVCSSKPQDLKVFTCKMDNTSGVSKGLPHKVLHSASAEKMEKGSVVSEFKMVPASFSALDSEKVSDHKLLELKDKNYVKRSLLRTVGDPSELKINANIPKGVARQAQFIVPAQGKLVKVKLHSSGVKTPASDCGLLFVSKSKSESTTLGQPSCSTLKRPILYIKKTLGTKSSVHSDHHTGGSETVGRVQPAPGRSVFSLDSKMPRLEEVKISNNRPVVRILNASADSDKSTSARAGAAVSSASLFVIRKGNVPKEGGSTNTSPVIMKRKRSFETEPFVGHHPREECPPVSHKTYMHVKPKELKVIDAEPNIKKKKVSADAASVSENTATVLEVPDDKLLSMSVEIVKKEHEKLIASEIPEQAEEQPLPDGSVNERNFSVSSENAFVKSATLHQNCEEKHAPEVCTKLGLEKGIVKAPKPEAVTITADAPLVRKRRALSDTLVCGDINKSEGHLVSQDKRRKLSASEVSSLAEETMKLETVIETTGIIKVARSPPTRRVPITSTMEVTISPHGVEQNVQTLPVCKSEQCEVNSDDLEMEKDDPGKEFMQAKVVLEKLPMPVPGCLLSPPAQVKMKVKPEPQTLQKTLESVSVVLQATLPERSVGNQKLLELTKLQDVLAEPVKKQKIVKREILQNKTAGKSLQQKIMGKQAEQKIVRKQTQQKTVGKQSQEKIVRKQTAQKIMGKQKTVGKQTQQKIIGKQTQQRSVGKQSKQTVTGKQSQQKVLGKQASQTVIRKPSQQKIVKRLSQQKVIGRPSQQRYAGKPQHKVLGKSSQQKVMGRAYPQKITNKPTQQQKTLSKQKSVQKTSPRNMPSIAVRIASKKKRKKETPKKVVSSGSKTKQQKMEPSITAKKTIKAVSFGNLKYKQAMKSAVNQRPEAEKRIITMKEKSVTLNKIKENKFDKKEQMIVPPKNEKITFEERKKAREPLEMKIIQSAMKTFQQEKPVAMKRLPGPKKIVSDDRRMKKSQGILMEPSDSNAADDEWIVEVLLDDSEVNMMTLNSQVQVGQETHSSSVSSSDDKPKDLHVSTRNLDCNHLLECDSSTDLHRRSEAVGGGGEARRNISANKGNPCRTTLNTNVKQKVALPSVKQVTSSFNNAKRTGISAEQKMAEMRKAIGDLERIADRCMLRLKAEERQVSLLTNKLHQYENDKHYNMLSKILKDAAPGPNQNPHAEFILDLLMSYCPDDGDIGCQETLPAPV